jgi:hypothetical protein
MAEFNMASKYFKKEEANETLDCKFKLMRDMLVTRDYTYENGATYKGQWMGGMRHGKGTMLW